MQIETTNDDFNNESNLTFDIPVTEYTAIVVKEDLQELSSGRLHEMIVRNLYNKQLVKVIVEILYLRDRPIGN